MAGVPATVLAIESAPETKLERMRNLGAEVIEAPIDDHEFIAGDASIGLEIVEQLPDTQVVGVEPETAAPEARSFEEGEPQRSPDFEESFVDGAGGKSLFPRMWERMREVVDDVVVVSLDDTEDAVRTLAEQTRIVDSR